MGIDRVKDAPRRQHYYFAHEYLRERAQQHPKLLVEKLREESGTSYLSFLWVSRGFAVKGEEDEFIPADGLECFPIEIGSEYYGALVQFPTPEKMAEAYFVAILLPASEGASASAEFFTLEFSMDDDRSKKTVLGKWGGGSHFNLGSGPPPEKGAFLNAIHDLALNRPKRNIVEKAQKPARSYTFKVNCSFQIQYTFSEGEVQHDPDGNEEDFEPTNAALATLEQELEEHLLELYMVEDVDVNVSADSNSLLGIDDFETSD